MKPPKAILAALYASARRIDWPRHLESLCITFAILVFGSLFIFGLRLDSWVHELTNFLNHYRDAAPEARRGVEIVLLGVYGVALAIVVMARRRKKGVAHV